MKGCLQASVFIGENLANELSKAGLFNGIGEPFIVLKIVVFLIKV
jgi:hypothetical protein